MRRYCESCASSSSFNTWPGWTVHAKGGWGSGTGWADHQVALLTRGRERVAAAVLTMSDGTHAYGAATLRGVFARLLRRLPATTPGTVP